jgi:hypothetical protein
MPARVEQSLHSRRELGLSLYQVFPRCHGHSMSPTPAVGQPPARASRRIGKRGCRLLRLRAHVRISRSSHSERDRTGYQSDYPTDNGGRYSQFKDGEPGGRRVHDKTNREPSNAASNSGTYGPDDNRTRQDRKPHDGCDCTHA